MDKVDWSKAPEWADQALLNCNDDWLFSDGVRFITTTGSTEYRDRSDGNGGRWLGVDDFKAVKMRPDNWKEGEERMDPIGQNGNEGEHYAELLKRHENEIYEKMRREGKALEKIKEAEAKKAFEDIGNNKSKYQREIKRGVLVDVYDVLSAFEVVNPAMQHALKKMLAPGKRGAKDTIQDMKEAIQSIERAIELENDK